MTSTRAWSLSRLWIAAVAQLAVVASAYSAVTSDDPFGMLVVADAAGLPRCEDTTGLYKRITADTMELYASWCDLHPRRLDNDIWVPHDEIPEGCPDGHKLERHIDLHCIPEGRDRFGEWLLKTIVPGDSDQQPMDARAPGRADCHCSSETYFWE